MVMAIHQNGIIEIGELSNSKIGHSLRIWSFVYVGHSLVRTAANFIELQFEVHTVNRTNCIINYHFCTVQKWSFLLKFKRKNKRFFYDVELNKVLMCSKHP